MPNDPSQTTSTGADGVASPAVAKIPASPVRRRPWRAAILCGTVGGLVAVAIVWYFAPRQYTAVALLQLSVGPPNLIFTADRQSASDFQIFKATQQQLLTSDNVLIAALRKPEAASLPAIQKEDDPVRWLSKNLRVDFPGNAEIMRVSLSCTNPYEAATLVDAVVDAYMSEAVYLERDRQRERLRAIEGLYTDKEAEIRRRRTEVKLLAEQVGSADPGLLAVKQQLAIQQLSEARGELATIRSESRRAQDDLQINQARLKALQSAPQQLADSEGGGAADLAMARLLGQIDAIEKRLAALRDSAKESNVKDQLAGILAAQKDVESKLAELRMESAAKLKKASANLEPEIANLKIRIDILKAAEESAAKCFEEIQKKAERLFSSSVDVDMMRHELQYLENSLLPIADERERLKVELRSGDRVSYFQKAEPPNSPDPLFVIPDIDPKTRQHLLIVLFVLAAVLVPAGLVLAFFRRREA
jgi:polysaccharide biosynthesis transport protein